jgi:1-phosphofructokinase family hexose kinase
VIHTLTLNPAVDRELRVPAIAFGEVLRATGARVDSGGKGFNVSRALKALGEESVALGFVGGHAGRLIAAGLEALRIAVDFVEVAGGETRTNVTVVAPDRHVKVNEAGPSVSGEEVRRLREKVQGLARPGDLWILSGSLPPGASPGIYAELTRLLQAAGARVLLDASGRALAEGCAAAPLLVKPNDGEAAELTGLPVGSEAQARAAAAAVRRLGPALVLLSMGKRGALLAGEGRAWLSRPPAIVEQNPIGAGDAMLAGFAFGLARALPLPDALRWATAAGAAAASLPGTGVGDRALVERLAGEVEIEPLDG